MKQTFAYDKRNEALRLWVNNRVHAYYPLTYTPEECLEDWCDGRRVLFKGICYLMTDRPLWHSGRFEWGRQP